MKMKDGTVFKWDLCRIIYQGGEYAYNAQLCWEKDGEIIYTGVGKFFKNLIAARNFANYNAKQTQLCLEGRSDFK